MASLPADVQRVVDDEAKRCGIEQPVLTYLIERLVAGGVLLLPVPSGSLAPEAEARTRLGQFAAAKPVESELGPES